jgi:hypothetical protein
MTSSPQFNRRQWLQTFVGAPLLPLATSLSGASMMLSACGGTTQTLASFVSASFASMPAPSLANAAQMATTTVGSSLNLNFNDGSQQSYKLSYQPFFVTGDLVSDGKGGKVLSGGYYDINNKPILDTTVAGKERQYFSDSPDGTSLLTVPNLSLIHI